MKVDIYNTDKKYSIIYADPPWAFKYRSKKGEEKKSAQAHYSCMSNEELKQLPTEKISGKDAVLFMWVTFPFLEQGLELIKSWGFTYKTCGFNWIKRNKRAESLFVGCGYWTRANSELSLIATRGKPKRLSRSVRQVVMTRVEEHSKKPSEVRDRIVSLCGDIPKIELFARQYADGWDCWGNEV